MKISSKIGYTTRRDTTIEGVHHLGGGPYCGLLATADVRSFNSTAISGAPSEATELAQEDVAEARKILEHRDSTGKFVLCVHA